MFVYDALIEALQSGETSIACVDFHKAYLELQKVNPETGKVRLQEEYDVSRICCLFQYINVVIRVHIMYLALVCEKTNFMGGGG